MSTVLPVATPTLADAARLIQAGRLSPLELTQACLAQVARLDAQVHAFSHLSEASALSAARTAQAELASGRWRGPLHGIPVGIKDVIDVAGMPTRAQSRQLDAYIPRADAAAVAHWHAAGAVSLGKLTTHEFAFGSPQCWPPGAGQPGPPARNPWHTAHFAGGSSSGAAVAVACGMVLGALGSDTAGSVRSPAALCGMTGFKPGRARIDRRGVFALAHSLDALGVIGATAEDCALLYLGLRELDGGVSASAAPLDGPRAAALECDVHGMPQLYADVRGMRVGVALNFFTDMQAIGAECGNAIDAALGVFRQAGCEVTDVALPSLELWNAAGMVMLLAEAYALHEPWLRNQIGRYGRSFSDAVLPGAALSAQDYDAAVQVRHQLTAQLDAAMAQCDVLVAPIQPGAAPRLDALSQWGFLERPSYGVPFNLADKPALSLCCGMSAQGLPLALQLVGHTGGEATVLRMAHAYQMRSDWHTRARTAPARLSAQRANGAHAPTL